MDTERVLRGTLSSERKDLESMSDLMYRSTRRADDVVTASRAVLNGLSADGGLYVPESIPQLPRTMGEFAKMDYRETAFEILKCFLTDYTDEELRHCVDGAYDAKFDDERIVPVTGTGDDYYLELYHGPTIAFKDMALSILPYLMTIAAKKQGIDREIVILTATSGDTGKAALAGFADVPGTKIIVFYPKDGVSPIQKLQMVTQKGANTCVIGVDGNFDDCQTGVKKMFTDEAMKEELAAAGCMFSSANSINIGRLVPQVVYYVYAYARLLSRGVIEEGEPINVTVPTGNFGNILAAYIAKKMGTPIDRLICASNENRVLTDFFESGVYDRNREFILTSSPSMDILISSNLERLIYWICGSSPERCVALMKELSETGKYTITDEMRAQLKDFEAGSAAEAEVFKQIRTVFGMWEYLLDPHTAVASRVTDAYRDATGDMKPCVIASTASPYKFTRNVMYALTEAGGDEDDFDLANELSRISGVPVPQAVTELRGAEIRHKSTCAVDEMPAKVREFLGI